MLRLLLVVPACDGNDVGEAWVGHQWAAHMSSRYDTTVLTTRRHGKTSVAAALPGARVVEWETPAVMNRFDRFTSLAKPDYVLFQRRARRWIRDALRSGDHFDVAHQPVPVAMRYPSPVTGTGIPLVLGPIGGGLSDPPGFSRDEDTAPWYTGLRRIDGWRLAHDPILRRTYQEAACVLGIADYVADALASMRLRRFEILSETAISEVPGRARTAAHDPFRLLFVGRVIRTKGLRDAIASLDHLRDLAVHLDVVGQGPDEQACRALADQLGVADRVTFHGWQSREKVSQFYRRSDAFVFPSYREPGGNVVFEAMSFGLPLVVVDRGGPGAAVDDASGFRVPAQSPAQLGHDIATAVRALTDPDTHARMSRAALQRVREVGLWSTKVEQMGRIYAEVAAARDAGDDGSPTR